MTFPVNGKASGLELSAVLVLVALARGIPGLWRCQFVTNLVFSTELHQEEGSPRWWSVKVEPEDKKEKTLWSAEMRITGYAQQTGNQDFTIASDRGILFVPMQVALRFPAEEISIVLERVGEETDVLKIQYKLAGCTGESMKLMGYLKDLLDAGIVTEVWREGKAVS
ncbi:MAG: hypothetical protein A2542_03720 [Parcubacteria group bacterium RIFOXYD2_FULL_52_8]|nr:MAG: hypothetical protein A2542_03720 [Parcubacteria group bacterium RIFOXYD2_FULL_52_8]